MKSKECKWYLKGGLCSHPDAPNPNHSRCLELRWGNMDYTKLKCEVYEKESQ